MTKNTEFPTLAELAQLMDRYYQVRGMDSQSLFRDSDSIFRFGSDPMNQ
jgi:cobalamin biosynthesis Mg chelatase CobN